MDSLPFIYRKKLERLIKDETVNDLMLGILETLPMEAQIAFIQKLGQRPVGRPPDQRISASGELITDTEKLKLHRQSFIKAIEMLRQELGIQNRLRRNPGAGSVFLRKDKDRPSPYWCGFVDLKSDPAGKRKRKKFRGKTREEVLAKMDPYLTKDSRYESEQDAKTERHRRYSASSFKALERLSNNLQKMLEKSKN